ncbi:MAG: tungstate ABC transporter ATP-binding protein WtpC [Candidatus Saliniplasma sp.]
MIEIEGISCSWDDFELLDIDLKVKNDEYFVILGPTGSGKTLLLELLAGFHRPERGRIKVEDEDYTGLPPNKRNFAFVYQDYMLFPHMNVQENIGYGLKIRKGERIKRKVEEAAEMVGISHLLDRKPLTLSGGEKQRVSLARALVLEPDILLMDEPFGSLDYQTKKELRSLVKKLHSRYSGTIIHVTHDQEEAVIVGDRVAVMKEGEIIQVGKPEEIMRRPKSKFTAEFVGVENIFHGKAERVKDTTKVVTDDIEIHSTSVKEGDVIASIRPEDIIISDESFRSSARNNFEGVVISVTDRGNFHQILVDIGIPLIIYVTKQSVDMLDLKKKKEVFVMFKASAVHLFTDR